MSTTAANVKKLMDAALDGLHTHAATCSAEDIASACINLALRASIAVLDLSTPTSAEHNREVLLEGIDEVRKRLQQWPLDADDRQAWN